MVLKLVFYFSPLSVQHVVIAPSDYLRPGMSSRKLEADSNFHKLFFAPQVLQCELQSLCVISIMVVRAALLSSRPLDPRLCQPTQLVLKHATIQLCYLIEIVLNTKLAKASV